MTTLVLCDSSLVAGNLLQHLPSGRFDLVIRYPGVSCYGIGHIELTTAPLLFPFQSKTNQFPKSITGKSLSRAPSVSSIYAPPPPAQTIPTNQATTSGRTPGRRGEKRPRQSTDRGEEDDRKRKAGRIVIPTHTTVTSTKDKEENDKDEDIFGKRGSSIRPFSMNGDKDRSGLEEGKNKRTKIPQQVLDNKGVS